MGEKARYVNGMLISRRKEKRGNWHENLHRNTDQNKQTEVAGSLVCLLKYFATRAHREQWKQNSTSVEGKTLE
jgi:hypothetical protein